MTVEKNQGRICSRQVARDTSWDITHNNDGCVINLREIIPKAAFKSPAWTRQNKNCLKNFFEILKMATSGILLHTRAVQKLE